MNFDDFSKWVASMAAVLAIMGLSYVITFIMITLLHSRVTIILGIILFLLLSWALRGFFEFISKKF
jgi:hypothetical protein